MQSEQTDQGISVITSGDNPIGNSGGTTPSDSGSTRSTTGDDQGFALLPTNSRGQPEEGGSNFEPEAVTQHISESTKRITGTWGRMSQSKISSKDSRGFRYDEAARTVLLEEKWRTTERLLRRLGNVLKDGKNRPDALERAYRVWITTRDRWGVVLIVLNAMNALFAVGLEPYVPQQYISGINALISSAASVIGAVLAHYDYNSKIIRAHKARLALLKLGLRMTNILRKHPAEREEEPSLFAEEVINEYNSVIETLPVLPSNWRKRKRKDQILELFKDEALMNPYELIDASWRNTTPAGLTETSSSSSGDLPPSEQ